MKVANPHAPHKSLFGEPRVVVGAALPDREDVYCPLCNREPEPFAVDFQGFQLVRCTRSTSGAFVSMWCASTMCANTRKIRSLSYVELMTCSRRRGSS